MKTTTAFLLLFTMVFITSCEGPMGPPGEDGTSLIGTVFEISGDFTPQNGYSILYDFPNNFEIYNGDVVLVYILWEVDNGTDIWRLLPQTVVLDDGVLQYNFDHTLYDVKIFLEGTTDFNNLRPAETDNQVFRIAVLPANLVAQKSIDYTNFDSLRSIPGLKLNTTERILLK